MELKENFIKAAQALKEAQTLVITSGAGMGVDSGLPDFRGNEGFWKAYPLYKRLGLNFMGAANPQHFQKDPALGWGFYGHRLNLYRATEPHQGFDLLKKWIKERELDYFIVTSNVDGQFQKAGFPEDKILEVHGSIHFLQCVVPCCEEIWKNEEKIEVEESTMRAKQVPYCPYCGNNSRPNVLMFGDYSWIGKRTWNQERRFQKFLLPHYNKKIAVVEIGAGTAIPTIRNLSEDIARWNRATVIRINPREYHIGSHHIPLACGGLEGLMGIDKALKILIEEEK